MITIIVAVDESNLIGTSNSANGMAWHNKEDFQHFKQTTLHHTLVMGRKTYEAIGRPLPQRHTIVITRGEMDDDRVEVRHSLDEVLDEFKNSDEDLMICGGASIYKQALGVANRMLLSRIPGKHEGDTYFPDIKQSGLKLSERKPFDTFTLEIYER